VIALKVSEGLLLIATLVASLTEKLAVLLLRHTLATLLNNGTHEDLTKMDLAVKLKEQPDSCSILAEFGFTL
jgi:hypothetical protein